jgi:hypothetical protein
VEEKEPPKSNLHPEKLTYAKFSEMRRSLDDDKMTVGRLILYVVLVIAIGIALTIGVQSYIRYQNDQQNQANNNPSTISQPVQSIIKVNSEFQSDNRAQPPILAADKFSDKNVAIGTDITAAGPFNSWNSLKYDRYNTTERLTLEFGIEVKDPKAVVSYSATDKVLYIDIDKLATSKTELKPGTELIKLATDTTAVKTVQNSSTGNKLRLSVYVSEPIKFTALYSSGKLIVDIRQADLVTGNTMPVASAPVATTTPSPSTTPTTTVPAGEKPAAPFYDNKYSKATQYISSSYTGNKLRIWNYTYRDYGDRYEFKFRVKDDGSKVNPMKPNVKAYLNGNANDPKLYVEVSNINWEILNKSNANCFDNVGYGNVKRICGKFEADKNMVTYTIDLYKLADFELDSIENSTVDPSRPGEVIWLKIKDN